MDYYHYHLDGINNINYSDNYKESCYEGMHWNCRFVIKCNDDELMSLQIVNWSRIHIPLILIHHALVRHGFVPIDLPFQFNSPTYAINSRFAGDAFTLCNPTYI